MAGTPLMRTVEEGINSNLTGPRLGGAGAHEAALGGGLGASACLKHRKRPLQPDTESHCWHLLSAEHAHQAIVPASTTSAWIRRTFNGS